MAVPGPSELFPVDFLIALRVLVNVHHSIYRQLPPSGRYFESIVQQAFTWAKKPFTPIENTGRTLPAHDLLVDGLRISIKTETGEGTDHRSITISKLCTTERPPWTAGALRERVLKHLAGYDVILMLRAIWDGPLLRYQLIEIPVDLLRRIADVELKPAGKGSSLAADVYTDSERRAFRIFLDSSDRKCSIRNLSIGDCALLMEWDLHIGEVTHILETSEK
jgi:hypothetical protein